MSDKETNEKRGEPVGSGFEEDSPDTGAGPKSIWRDPYKLGILLQLALIALLVSLLVYSIFPFYTAAKRLDLSPLQILVLPIAIGAVAVFFARRALRLLRALKRDGP